MKFLKVKTRLMLPPKDDIFDLLNNFLPRLHEGDVLLITSKILAIHQGRCVKISPRVKYKQLVMQEADRYLKSLAIKGMPIILTLKDNTLIPSAGIDESNGNGYYILWPKSVNKLLEKICRYLKKKYRLKKLAVISTDSHTIPLRFGVLGISTGSYGLQPVHDFRGHKDLFGRALKYTRVNIVDALSAMGVLLMGESDERTPLLIVRGAGFVRFTTKHVHRKLLVPAGTDLYTPLLKAFHKKNE